jgi:hypothetical protein
MLWFFERDEQSIRLETRYDNDTSEYVLALIWPDGREQIERFTDSEQYRLRLVAVEGSLEGERWVRRGPPVVLPDGWPNRRLT